MVDEPAHLDDPVGRQQLAVSRTHELHLVGRADLEPDHQGNILVQVDARHLDPRRLAHGDPEGAAARHGGDPARRPVHCVPAIIDVGCGRIGPPRPRPADPHRNDHVSPLPIDGLGRDARRHEDLRRSPPNSRK
jgi:hypothetical protein